MIHSETLLEDIPKITPKYLKLLHKLELKTVEDFLFYLPFRYDDFSQTVSPSDEYLGSTVTICATVTRTKLNKIFKRKLTISEVYLEDENQNLIKATWFNQPFIIESMPVGTELRLSGKLERIGKYFTLSAPVWERASREKTNTGQLVPVYHETPGLTSKWIRWQMKTLLEKITVLEDFVPDELRKKLHLYSIKSALGQIHFPQDPEKLLIAKKTFAFREMFLMQLKSLQMKNIWEMQSALKIKEDKKLIENFTSNLPFQLTNAQKKSIKEIILDLEKPCPMNRLLNGDVGAGKTIVATVSALGAMKQKHQVAILAPTEVLALQHFEGICKTLEKYNFNIALLTRSYKLLSASEKNNQENYTRKTQELSRIELLKSISNNEAQLIIGTHAIIQKDVNFSSLALVIIDEQHRFGVAQRSALQQEAMELKDGETKTIPHLLTMTATPIPRTLAIAFFGSLDLSILDELPKNRKPIITKIILPLERKKVYDFMQTEIEKGRQVFVILPLVEKSEMLTEVKAVTEEHEKLSKIFPHYSLGLLHGRLKSAEKEAVMKEFKDNKTQILVSTSVVEVGIDIPNATIIAIENSERFGLSQLHQFRGRVGRGQHQSYCFLFTQSQIKKSLNRLCALEKTNDGFELSEVDLKMRGPGQLLGKSQSGISDLAMENLNNLKLVKIARTEAQNILANDAQLKKHPLIANALRKFSENVHLE